MVMVSRLGCRGGEMLGTRYITTYNAKEAYMLASALSVTYNISGVTVSVYDTGEGKYTVRFDMLDDGVKAIVNEIIKDLEFKDINKIK